LKMRKNYLKFGTTKTPKMVAQGRAPRINAVLGEVASPFSINQCSAAAI